MLELVSCTPQIIRSLDTLPCVKMREYKFSTVQLYIISKDEKLQDMEIVKFKIQHVHLSLLPNICG
jgi:hypothetical protein